ncbi:MAG: hypothetical protein A2X46_04130 [Lentisphaerae bacterium GWF2_57_35]|nr:MAG: hypothetical protein A2X46_04130 [Lentisphaerae bacterium GWF2_57_35]
MWAFIHNELDERERTIVQKELAHSAEFRQEMVEVQKIDRELNNLSQAMKTSEDELENTVLAAWERESQRHEKAREPNATDPSALLTTQRSWWVRSHKKFASAALALAASLMLVMGVRNYTSSELAWAEPEIRMALKFRGEGGATELPIYSKKDMQTFASFLRETIKKNYRRVDTEIELRSFLKSNTQWTLVTKLQEMRAQTLYVQVEAYDRQLKTLTKAWAKQFDNSDVFYSKVDDFGAQVAQDLASMHAQRDTSL